MNNTPHSAQGRPGGELIGRMVVTVYMCEQYTHLWQGDGEYKGKCRDTTCKVDV